MNDKTNLLDFDKIGLESYFKSIGEKSYRAQQILKWIHYRGVVDFAKMTDLSKALREKLMAEAQILVPKIITVKSSADGTKKFLLQMNDGKLVEMVYIPENARGTLCISTQVGCPLACAFCSTGMQGFARNLTIGEIIGQLWCAARYLSTTNNGEHDRHVTNVVIMGMGEPLLNFDNLIPALNLMMDDLAYGLAKKRVTVSTSGIVPKIYELAKAIDVSLAVSLHAPNDKLRNSLMPINKKYPLRELMAACREYVKVDPHKSITFEYVMLNKINDEKEHAHELAKLLKDVPSKINLIPFHSHSGAKFKCSSNNRIHYFQDILIAAGFTTTIRKSRGDDIDAACGQLVAGGK